MTDAAQERTLEEVRQELLWLRDLVAMALRRFGCDDADSPALPAPAPPKPAAAPASEAEGAEKMVAVEVIAQRVNLTPRVIRRYVRDQMMPFRRLGNSERPRIRFYVSEVESWVDGAALKSIGNGVTLASGQMDVAAPVSARKGQKIKRTPHLKRRLSYT